MLWLILLVIIPIVMAELWMLSRWGDIRGRTICPRCEACGKVRVKRVKRMAKFHGCPAEISMDGWSLLTTKLRRKEMVTQAHCSRCGMTWYPGTVNQQVEKEEQVGEEGEKRG